MSITPTATPTETLTTTPSCTPITGKCCAEFPQVDGFASYPMSLSIEAYDLLQVKEDLKYNVYLDDGTVLRSQDLSWDREQGYRFDLSHTYSNTGFYNCYLVLIIQIRIEVIVLIFMQI